MPDAAFAGIQQADPLLSPEVFSPASPLSARGPLHAGSTWAGVQRSGRNSYEVTVKIDTVDMVVGTVTGTLEIRGLTPELESLVTFFEGEIVGEVGGPGFRTGQYGATEIDDLKHWRRFPAFTRNRLENQLVKPGLHLRNAHGRPFVFMRWKEQFVTSHRVEAIHGASYAGFYYCCLDCDPSAFSPEAAAHRSLSRTPSRGPPTATRRRSSTSFNRNASGSAGVDSNLSAQTRPAASRTLSIPPPQPAIHLPPVSQTVPRPLPPRRASSGAFSYAAALRGEGSPDLSSTASASSASSSASTSPITPSAIPGSAAPDFPTPKLELESAFSTLSAPNGEPTPAVDLPPLWQTISNSPQHSSRASLHPAPPADEAEWPAPSPFVGTSASRPVEAMMRRISSDVANVLAKTRRGRSGGGGRRKSIAEQPAVVEAEGALDDRGLRSWTDATISGFYFHHSASPYQELSLRYVSATHGGSSAFGFR